MHNPDNIPASAAEATQLIENIIKRICKKERIMTVEDRISSLQIKLDQSTRDNITKTFITT